jgi:hypothetical protein
MIDFFAIRHGLNSRDLIERTDMSRVLQLLHTEGIYRGGSYLWTWYPEPPKELMDMLDKAGEKNQYSWEDFELC